jgi:MoaA/NifB/PqqE/SkfB family radical SAM enzyme
MCFEDKMDDFGLTYKKRLTKDIMLDIKRGKESGFEYLEFIGGEPTLTEGIISLTQYAYGLGFKVISLTTNGRMFSYRDFCNRIIESGLNRISISLHAHVPKIHNRLVRASGAFEQILQGINNIKKYKQVHLEIKSVLVKHNYKFIQEMKNFF